MVMKIKSTTNKKDEYFEGHEEGCTEECKCPC